MTLGTLSEIWRYPVKSMAGQSLTESEVYWYGLVGDRRYGFVQSGLRSQFPWLTARELPELVRYEPAFENDDIRFGPLEVSTPSGEMLPIDSDKLRKELETQAKRSVHLLHLNRGTSDTGAISLISRATLRHLEQHFGLDIDLRRFRQNLIVETEDDTPYIEDSWVGRQLQVGSGVRLAVIRPIQRCVMINVDPQSATRDPRMLKGINALRDNCLGVYLWPTAVGHIHLGDPLTFVEEK